MGNDKKKNRRVLVMLLIIFSGGLLALDMLVVFNHPSVDFISEFLPTTHREEDKGNVTIVPDNDRNISKEDPKEEEKLPEEPIEDTTLTYENEPVTPDGHFFELQPTIGLEQAYIAHPVTIDTEKPPTIIVYSHGSNTLVTTDFSDPFMLDMRAYGEYFTKHNYIFAASNMHGANWGSEEARQDMQNMIEWIKEEYPTAEPVNLIGFSMGGLPTFLYAFDNPEQISHIAGLAPTTRPELWTEEMIRNLEGIDTKIWHGEADVNVPWSLSNQFVTVVQSYEVPIQFESLPGLTHWDVDTEFMEEIKLFFDE